MTAQPHVHARFRRAIERRALWMAEDAVRELPSLPPEDALQLVHLYFEQGSPKARGGRAELIEGRLALAIRRPTLFPSVRLEL